VFGVRHLRVWPRHVSNTIHTFNVKCHCYTHPWIMAWMMVWIIPFLTIFANTKEKTWSGGGLHVNNLLPLLLLYCFLFIFWGDMFNHKRISMWFFSFIKLKEFYILNCLKVASMDKGPYELYIWQTGSHSFHVYIYFFHLWKEWCDDHD